MSTTQEKIDRLRSSIAAQTSVIASVLAFAAGLAQQIRDAKDDPQELEELANQVEANSGEIAKATAVLTPASDEVLADDGGTGDDETAVDPEGVEIVEAGDEAETGADTDLEGDGGAPAEAGDTAEEGDGEGEGA